MNTLETDIEPPIGNEGVIPLVEYIGPHPKDRYYDREYWRELREKYDVPEFKLTEKIDVLSWLEKARTEGWLDAVKLKARGTSDALPNGGLPETINMYLNMLIFLTGGPPGPIGRQFIGNPNVDKLTAARPEFQQFQGFVDSLEEDDHAVVFDHIRHPEDKEQVDEVPCLIHKYEDRVLMLVTRTCAAYCDYCTRGRMVGFGHPTSQDAIGRSFDYIAQHPEIREIIFSGGDAMMIPDDNFDFLVERVNQLIDDGHDLQSVRFGTRSIIHNGITPGMNGLGKKRNTVISERQIEALGKLKTVPHIMLHICHPWEITTQVSEWINILSEKTKAQFHSQSVLLANVNDDRRVLKELFRRVQGHGIQPYYVYLCDLVEWGLDFLVSIPRAKKLFYRIKDEMGGLAVPQPVIDVAQGKGKIPLFSEYWVSDRLFEDYDSKLFVVVGSWHEPYDQSKHGDLTHEEKKELARREKSAKEMKSRQLLGTRNSTN